MLEMSFLLKANKTTPTINIHNLHKAFISKLLEITEGDAHIMPTMKGKDTTTHTTISTKGRIISFDAFPTTTYLHGQFFKRVIYYNEKTKRTVVKVMHQVLMKEPIHVVKKKMMEFLRINKIWLKNGDLNAVETSGFGWFLAAHDSMVFCPTLKNTLVTLINNLPGETFKKAIREYGTPDDKVKLPENF